jgi:hypothetical protein
MARRDRKFPRLGHPGRRQRRNEPLASFGLEGHSLNSPRLCQRECAPNRHRPDESEAADDIAAIDGRWQESRAAARRLDFARGRPYLPARAERMMRRRTFLILAGASLIAPAAFAADAAPADIVASIYRLYAGPKGDYQSGSIEDKRVAAFFTRSLRAALKAMDARSRKLNEPILDFDPITDSQDPLVERLSVAPESDNAAAATFYSGEAKHVVRYVFVREDGAWRIDDIAGGAGDDKWDLREIIKPGAK